MALIDLHMLEHPCEHGMYPTWSNESHLVYDVFSSVFGISVLLPSPLIFMISLHLFILFLIPHISDKMKHFSVLI